MSEQTLRDGVVVRPAGGRKSLWWGIAAGLACLILGVMTCAWLFQTPTLQVVRLPGGRTIRLVATTYGTKNLCLDGPRWRRLLLPLVGTERARAWGWRVAEFPHPKPLLIYWIAESNGRRGAERLMMSRVLNERHSAIPGISTFGMGGDGHAPSAVAVEKFPRRGRYVYLDYQTFGNNPFLDGQRVGRLVALNPTPGPYPQWKPGPLPQAVRVGKQTFRLKRFLVSVGDLKTDRPAPNPDFGFTTLAFEVSEEGKVSQECRPLTASFANATGDSWQYAAWSAGKSLPDKLWMPWSLGTEEAAWKIGVRFARTTGFTPSETWTLRSVPLPPAGPRVLVNRLLERDGTRVRLHTMELNRSSQRCWRVLAGLQVSPQPAGAYLTLTGISDERGRSLTAFGDNLRRLRNEGTVSAASERQFPLDVPAGTRRISLTLALHRSKNITFLAAPEVAKAIP